MVLSRVESNIDKWIAIPKIVSSWVITDEYPLRFIFKQDIKANE